MLVTFFVTPLLVLGLGDAQYGIWAVVMSLTSYYGLADLGLRGACTKYIAQYHAARDPAKVNKVLMTSWVLYGGFSLLPLLISLLVAAGIRLAIHDLTAEVAVVRLVVVIVGFNVSVQLLGNVFAATLVAIHRFDVVNIIGIISKVCSAVGMVVVLRMGGGLLGMALIVLAIGILSQLANLFSAKVLLPYFALRAENFDRKLVPSLVSFGGANLFINGANRVTDYVGSVIIGVFMGPTSVTYYAIAEGLVRRGVSLGRAVTGVAMPVASQLDARGERKKLLDATIITTRGLTILAAVMIVVIFSFGERFIEYWIGANYGARVFPVMCLLAMARGITVSFSGARSILVGMGYVNVLAKLSVVESVAIIFLGTVLVNLVGFVGMAWSLFVVQVVTSGIALSLCVSRIFHCSWLHFLRDVLILPAIASIPGAMLALCFNQIWPATNLISVMLHMLAVTVVIIVTAFSICFERSVRDSMFSAAFPRVRLPGRPAVPTGSEKSD